MSASLYLRRVGESHTQSDVQTDCDSVHVHAFVSRKRVRPGGTDTQVVVGHAGMYRPEDLHSPFGSEAEGFGVLMSVVHGREVNSRIRLVRPALSSQGRAKLAVYRDFDLVVLTGCRAN